MINTDPSVGLVRSILTLQLARSINTLTLQLCKVCTLCSPSLGIERLRPRDVLRVGCSLAALHSVPLHPQVRNCSGP